MQAFRRLSSKFRQGISPRLAIYFILGAFLVLSIIYAWATPPFEASDELWHFGVIQHIADTGQLPVQQIGLETAWEQEGSQPPLYYMIAALLVKPIDRGDFEAVTQPNPHAQTGIPGFVGNKNLVLHDSPHPPLHGTVLAVYMVRGFSILLGCVTIFAVYRAASSLGFDRPLPGILAAGLAAFNPMFLFITASVNNDNLVTALNSLIIWQMIELLYTGLSIRRSIVIALLLALASLSKLSALVLIPVVIAAALWHIYFSAGMQPRYLRLALRRGAWRPLLIFLASIIIAWLVIAGWWYVRNLNLYGELFGTRTMAAVAGVREEPFTLNTLVSEYQGFRFAYWALFGGVNIMTFRWFYDIMDILTLCALVGLGVNCWEYIRDYRRESRLKTSPISAMGMLYFLVDVALLGSIVLIGFISIAAWTSQTYASQGRLLFPFIAAIKVLMALGILYFFRSVISRLLSRRARHRYQRLIFNAPPYIIVGLLAVFALIVPFASIVPQYAPPTPLTALPEGAQPVYARFGDVALVGYETPEQRYQPGDQIPITAYWQVIEPAERDNSLFLHAINPAGDVIGKVDSYPGAGRLRTTTWETGAIYPDTYAIPLDETVAGRFPLRIQVGWWHYPTQEYIPAVNESDQPIEAVVLDAGAFGGDGENAIPDDLMPVSVDFGRAIRLIGYKLEGDQLTLAWESLAPLPDDYTVFAQVLASSKAIVGQGDAPPTMPTRYWLPGERYVTQHTIVYPTKLTPGDYPLVIGWYKPPDFNRLSVDYPDSAYPLLVINIT